MLRQLYIPVLLICLTACKDDEPLPDPPVLQLIAPKTAVAGSTITIKGSNFGTSSTDNVVMFGNVAAVITSATATELKVIIPWEGQTGKISVTANGATGQSVDNFIIEPAVYNISFYFRNSSGEDLLVEKTTGFIAAGGANVSWLQDKFVVIKNIKATTSTDASMPEGSAILLTDNQASYGLMKFFSFARVIKSDTLLFEYNKTKLEKLYYNKKPISLPQGMTDFPTKFPVVIVK